ncbi:methionyl-tRNA formyltransferase [Aeromicrobium sp. 636]|uniref:Methionyl-tRNA formyltransferase n=1 Tax=Aeromicrobium senzhongii TaxID=2663859 RepID=A0A8I0JZY7_9ACTN|nr:methionyl-tRNA formyltransferase [Aeromicrobium sp. 636]MBC9225218.1 methionyl-tRNA formyltransferase [Aeromicrobium senzhongii]MCQ3997328.1 methionyl-tRNA formyltransferase [Aeromicrobium sp. 636]
MKIVFAGTPATAVPTLEALVASRHEVAAVITRPDARVGRGRSLQPSPVAVAAEAHGIPVLKPTSTSDPEFLDELAATEARVGVIVAYGALLRRDVLDALEFGWINLHYSVLPSWRGAAPVQRSIMAGDEVTGATVFSLVEALDAGPVLGTITERIREDDTTGTLLDRLSDQGARLVVDVVDHIEDGDIGAVSQPEDGVSYAHKLSTEDARIDWRRPAFAIDRHVRGCTPAPGAWTEVDGARLKVGPLTIAEDSTLEPGVAAIGKREVRVGTATTDVILGEVQPHGKKAMNAADWGRGLGGATEVVFA